MTQATSRLTAYVAVAVAVVGWAIAFWDTLHWPPDLRGREPEALTVLLGVLLLGLGLIILRRPLWGATVLMSTVIVAFGPVVGSPLFIPIVPYLPAILLGLVAALLACRKTKEEASPVRS